MKLLAVSWEFPPMYGPRATQVSRALGALVPLGWQPTVVCLDPRRGGPNWRDGVAPLPVPGVQVLRVKSPEEWTIVRALWRLMPALRDRPDPKWVWIPRAADAGTDAAMTTTFDGLASFAQPWSSHLAALRIHRQTKLPWVAHFSDPWIDSPYWTGTTAQRAAAAEMEQQVVREAAALVFVTEEAADLVMKKYPRELRSKASVVPHGFVPPTLEGSFRRSHPGAMGEPMRLVYTGRFYDGLRTPTALLRALAALHTQESLEGLVEFTFVGPFVTPFAAEARSLGVDRLARFKEKVPQADAQAIAESADVLVVIDAPTNGPSPFLPSKLVDYLPLRKPLLGITPLPGASASLIRRLGGSVAAPDDEAAMADALRDLISRWRDGTLSTGSGFDAAAAQYDITKTTAALSDVLTRAFTAAG
jgi:glycosyltransferase involved in cell wall biosynthesis